MYDSPYRSENADCVASTLKILFVISDFNQGGAQRQCVALANELSQKSGVSITICFCYSGHALKEVKSNVNTIKLGAVSLYDPVNLLRLQRVIRSQSPDIVVSWLHPIDVLCGLLKLFGADFRWAMTERDSAYPANWRYYLRDYLARFSDVVICNSEMGREYWTKRLRHKSNIKLVKNINLASGSARSVKVDGPSQVVFAGRIEPQKNVIKLAEAFCIAAKLSDAEFAIIGDGALFEEVGEILDRANLSNLRQEKFDPNINQVYMKSHVYVSLSFHEGTPNAVIENIEFGNCIVASRIPEHVALLGCDYPFLVDLDWSATRVAEVICRALTHFEPAMNDFALQSIREMVGPKIAEDYIEIIREVTRK